MFQAGNGNLTDDPEVIKTPGGVKVQAGVAHTPRWRDAAGEWQEGETVFQRLEWWGREAEAFAAEAQKGTPIVFVGEGRAHEWQTEDGEKRRRQFVAVERIGIVARPPKKVSQPAADAGKSVAAFLDGDDA